MDLRALGSSSNVVTSEKHNPKAGIAKAVVAWVSCVVPLPAYFVVFVGMALSQSGYVHHITKIRTLWLMPFPVLAVLLAVHLLRSGPRSWGWRWALWPVIVLGLLELLFACNVLLG